MPGCDNWIYNKKYVFDLCSHFWHRAPKTFGIYYRMSDKGALTFSLTWVYVNEVSDGKNISIGARWQKNQLNSLTLGRQGQGFGGRITPVANNLVNPDCVTEAFRETQKARVQRASGLVNTWRIKECGMCAQRGHEGSTPLPT